jgi:Protein of unknown function (DUF3108)
MKRTAVLTLLLSLEMPLTAHPARAAQLFYSFYIVGLHTADLLVGVDPPGPTYRASLAFHTTGLADMFSGTRLEETVSGRFDGDTPAPRDFHSEGNLHGQQRLLNMTWREGNPVVTAISPLNAVERDEVPGALSADTIDPLSAIVLLVRVAARTGRCEGAARAFDGRVLQAFESRTAGVEDLPPSSRSSFSGHTLRCDFTERHLAGFRVGNGRDDDLRQHRGSIWLAQIVPATSPLPVRIAIETRWLGQATIYLTSVAP